MTCFVAGMSIDHYNVLRRFERLPVQQVPPLWLVYSNSPSDSGAVHSPVKQRWLSGDGAIRRDMASVAQLAEQGKCVHHLIPLWQL